MARPSKYTPQLAERIAEAIARGLTREDAAAAAGIDAKTLYNWRDRYSSFSRLLTRAEAERVEYAFAQARIDGRGDWRYWFAFLDRVAPQYRVKTGLEVSGPDGDAIEIRGIDLPLPVRTDGAGDDEDASGPLLIPLPAKSNGGRP